MTSGNSLLRVVRISKLFRLIRMTRLFKIFKLVRNQTVVMAQFKEQLKISSGFERLINIGIFFVFFVHISGCLFVLLAIVEEEERVTWLRPDNDHLT
jgi:hypothetical protein